MNSEVANPPLTATAVSGGKRDLSIFALVVGIIGLAVGVIGLLQGLHSGDARPLLGWLIGFAYWLSIGIGMLFLLMIFYTFDAGWSVVVRRQLEHAISSFKWLFLIFLPLLLIGWFYTENTGILWPWLNEHGLLPSGETVGEDVLYQAKSVYLNKGFFTLRVLFFFCAWIGLSEVLRRCSFSLEKDGNPKWIHLARKVSAGGIVLCALCTTFAAIDWFKSLEYHWFSTIYGVWFFAESMRAGLAGILIICLLLVSRGDLKGLFTGSHVYLLGCLMLAFTVFWAYISFSQYFLIYNANIPEETFWYSIREINLDGSKNSWWWVSMALVFCHFVFPFLYLLWYNNKFGMRVVFISVWILLFHFADIYWNILPGRIPDDSSILDFVVRPFRISLWDIATWIGVGGICTWSFLKSAKKVKPIPVRDPRIYESINAHE